MLVPLIQYLGRREGVSILATDTAYNEDQGEIYRMFSVTIGVANIEGNAFQRVKATVDTGAHYSLIPRSVLQKAGVKPYKSEVMEMADGSLKEYPIGRALMSYDGREEVCQVVFGEDSEPLLGALALEEFGLVVDPVGQKLLPRRLRGRPF